MHKTFARVRIISLQTWF